MAVGDDRKVLITGASTGIGEATALHLAELGFRVLAGVRREADAERLRGSHEGVEPITVDIVDAESVAAAVRVVGETTGDRGLHGLVNNAGVAVSGPVELLPVEEWRRQMEVNFLGHVAVTQALIPALRSGRGRIVNMSSVGGRMALPGLGAYNASKFAMEAFSDSLRRELRPWDVEVVVVEPGAVKTPIWDRGESRADSLLDQVPEESLRLYADLIEGLRSRSRQEAERGVEPHRVAEVVARALTARRPRTRYVVGRPEVKVRVAAARVLPDRAFDALVDRSVRGGGG